jgi:hypothetical protein
MYLKVKEKDFNWGHIKLNIIRINENFLLFHTRMVKKQQFCGDGTVGSCVIFDEPELQKKEAASNFKKFFGNIYNNLKGQSHEIFDPRFFHQSIPLRSRHVNILKYF